MAQRTISIDFDRESGKTMILVLDGESRGMARVTISEVTEPNRTCWVVRGGGGVEPHYYGSLETAFRNAMLSAVEVVTEDLLPTRAS